MIHKWFNAKRIKNASSSNRHSHSPTRSKSVFGQFEQLEEKRCLAFLGFFDGVSLEILQTADDGDVLVENTTGVWRATDNLDTFTFVDAVNLTVVMLPNTADRLSVAIDILLPGNLTLDLGDGVRDASLTGALNEMGGNLLVTSGAGSQQVLLTDGGAPVLIHGDAHFDMGAGFDFLLDNGGVITVDGDLSMVGVNRFEYSLVVGLPGPPITGGNVTIDMSTEEVESFVVSTGGGIIQGDLNYFGGIDVDHVEWAPETIGEVNIDLGIANPFFGDPQNADITGTVHGDITIVAGDANLGNEINLVGVFTGNIISYTGGNTVDVVNYSMVGVQADSFFILGGGDDTFVLNLPMNLLEIDYGNDIGDIFVNNIGAIDFEFDITNFHNFDFFYTALDDTLVMNQLTDTGNIRIDNDGGITGFDWQVFPGVGGVASLVPAVNLELTMIPNTLNDVEIDLFNPILASIDMQLGDGDRLIEFTGHANNPLRNISITAGAGSQHVDLSVNHPLGVATLNIDLGTDFDSVNDDANSLIIDEDFILTGVNHFEHSGLLSVFRHASIDTTGEVEDTLFASHGSFFVGGTFSYAGGDGSDDLIVNGAGGVLFNGTASIDLGGSTGGQPQTIQIDGPSTTFNSSLTISSTSVAGADFLITGPGTTFNGSLSVDLGGGANTSLFDGVLNSSSFSYAGGSGVDTVVYGLTGTPANLNVSLGAGDDIFTLQAVSSIASPLSIDFGPGNDQFINNYGAFDFDANLLGLGGFNHIYVLATDSLTSTQVEDLGNVTFDNNGPANAIQVVPGNTLTPVTNLTINMLDGSSSDLDVTLDSALAGNLGVHLGNGNRALNLDGADNSIGGNLDVTGGDGDQTVEVAVNNNLVVGGHASFDLGAGSDVVDEDGNDISITGNLDFAGVNFFENNGTMTVGGDVTVDSTAVTEATIFDDDEIMTIGGNFTYLGGDGRDEVTMNGIGGTSIGGSALINVGDNTVGGTQHILFNVPMSSVAGGLTVISTSSANQDSFTASPGASFGGDINIDLGGGPNYALIVGVFGGSSVVYSGGSGVDHVTFGTTGVPADVFITLGGGDDTFTLQAGASISPTTLFVDFGDNADTFNNNYGPFDFNAVLLGLDGFDHVYDSVTDSLTSTQVSDSGPVTVDNNGAGGSVQFGTNLLGPVTDLTISLVDGSSQLDVDLDNPLAGNLTVDLGNGTRDFNLTGTSNSIGGNLSVTAGSGSQTVEVAVNNDLSVGGALSLSLGADGDIVDEDGNNINVAGHATFVSVNQFLNDGTMAIGGNLSFTSSSSTDTDSFSTTAASSVGGDIDIDLGDGTNNANIIGILGGSNVTYNGGSGVDDVTFGTTGNPADVVINLGSGNDTFTLLPGASISPTTLTVDFGGGNDTFNNLFGNFVFDASLSNLNGFNHVYDLGNDSLTSTQVGSSGPVTVDNNGAGGAIRFLDGGTSELTTTSSLFITMSDTFLADIAVDFDSMFVGDVDIDLGNLSRELRFTGIDNTIDGQLKITGGAGNQTVELAKNASFSVTSPLLIDLGADFDTVDEDGNGVVVVGNLDLVDVNSFVNDGSVVVMGDLTVDNSGESENSQLIDNAILEVFGNLNYFGGDADDFVSLNGLTQINGNINIEGGNGVNDAVIRGVFGGTDIDYLGGIDSDNVTLGTTGNDADINVRLGAGSDTFVLDAATAIQTNGFRVDFGGGDDTFTSNYGVFDFNARILDLDGYNAFFDLPTGNVDIIQVSDTGDVTIDNNGPGDAVRYGTGTMNTISPANDVRLILQSNSSTNVTADFDNVRNGNTVLQLRSGNRDVWFTGLSNTYNGLLRVEASAGVQNVHLAVNADLNVNATLIVNGRDGSDTITADNTINIAGAMLLRGVNNFVNTDGLNVTGDFNVITLLEDQDTNLISNASFMVGGNLTYLGGGGVDVINFQTAGASIGGFTYIDIADSTDVFDMQQILLTGGFATDNLVVDGSTAVAGNVFMTDAATVVTNDVIVNFVSSSPNNTAHFFGNYGGTYGTYRGGSNSDFVVFGATASNMLFAALTAAGDDTFTIDAGADLDFLYVDFGPGNDILDNQLGPLPFDNNIFNN